MGKPKLTLYVDVVSPFGYMAYYVARHSPLLRNVDVTYRPIFLGGLMKSCDNRPPIQIRNKGQWINKERLRWARQFEIPMSQTPPEGFPVPTLPMMRALCALELLDASKLPDALDALYQAMWAEAKAGLGKPDGFAPILEGALGKDLAAKILEGATGKEAKAKLSENTDTAFKEGAFGLPWWKCENEKGEKDSFWGFDHFGQVVDFLGVGREGQAGMRAML